MPLNQAIWTAARTINPEHPMCVLKAARDYPNSGTARELYDRVRTIQIPSPVNTLGLQSNGL